MATLTVQETDRVTGLNITDNDVAADAGGDEFANTGLEMLYISNGDASAMTLTLVMPSSCDGVDPVDPTITVPAGEDMLVGPFPPDAFNDPSPGRMSITYSSVTSLLVMVFKRGLV